MRLLPLILLFACEDTTSPHDHDHGEQELITTVALTVTDPSGGTTTVQWSDAEGTGSPVADPLILSGVGSDYRIDVAFLNELASPAEDLTGEIEDEADEHQVFLTGDAIAGPATGVTDALIEHAVLDTDTNGFPLGLSHSLTVQAEGTGTMTLTLRHLPTQDGQAVKTGDLAEEVAAGGFGSLPGDTDVAVDFDVQTLP